MLNFLYLKKYKKNIIITTGDYNGIGSEITAKALNQLFLKPDTSITVFLPKKDSVFKKILIERNNLYVFYFDLNPQSIVAYAAKLCMAKKFHSLVNGPMSKGPYREYKSAGHTEILKKICKKRVVPVFLGSQFNIILATSHLPISRVSATYKKTDFNYLNKVANKVNLMTFKTKIRPVFFLGLNPHAGEGGLLGTEEKELQKSFPKINLISADGFFSQEKNYLKKTIVASYHDQGLIPFKMAHQSGKRVQITAGLPFLRVTVCHGTAKEIYGKNIAKFDSMLEAIKLAISNVY